MDSDNTNQVMASKLKFMNQEKCSNVLKPRFPVYDTKAMICARNENLGPCNV
jgi:hypothetical protein